MSITIKHKRGSAAQWAASNPVLAEGELGVELDTFKIKVGNGTLPWVGLPYIAAPAALAPDPNPGTGTERNWNLTFTELPLPARAKHQDENMNSIIYMQIIGNYLYSLSDGEIDELANVKRLLQRLDLTATSPSWEAIGVATSESDYRVMAFDDTRALLLGGAGTLYELYVVPFDGQSFNLASKELIASHTNWGMQWSTVRGARMGVVNAAGNGLESVTLYALAASGVTTTVLTNPVFRSNEGMIYGADADNYVVMDYSEAVLYTMQAISESGPVDYADPVNHGLCAKGVVMKLDTLSEVETDIVFADVATKAVLYRKSTTSFAEGDPIVVYRDDYPALVIRNDDGFETLVNFKPV